MNWTDESNGLVYVNWSAGEPVYKDDQNDCAYFSVSSATWNTKNCDERLPFVCEKGKNLSSKGISECWFSLSVESELVSESNAEVEDQTNYKARKGAQ